jgi:ATP-dependent Clp protease adaptor protein ClpS
MDIMETLNNEPGRSRRKKATITLEHNDQPITAYVNVLVEVFKYRKEEAFNKAWFITREGSIDVFEGFQEDCSSYVTQLTSKGFKASIL